MPQPITPATRLAITTLRGEGLTFDQIAARTGVHYDTVRRTLKRISGQTLKKYEAELATRESILKRMAYIMQNAAEYKDSISAAKLIAMMEGWLSPSSEPSVHVHVTGNADITTLEKEYHALSGKALESPTTQSNGLVEPSPLADAQTHVLSQPEASLGQSGEAKVIEGGVEPPRE